MATTDIGAIAAALTEAFKLFEQLNGFANSPQMIAAKEAAVRLKIADESNAAIVEAEKTGDIKPLQVMSAESGQPSATP